MLLLYCCFCLIIEGRFKLQLQHRSHHFDSNMHCFESLSINVCQSRLYHTPARLPPSLSSLPSLCPCKSAFLTARGSWLLAPALPRGGMWIQCASREWVLPSLCHRPLPGRHHSQWHHQNLPGWDECGSLYWLLLDQTRHRVYSVPVQGKSN